MAIVSDIQFQDAAVKPAALDTSCSFLAASFTASTSMAVGGDSVSPTGLFTAKSSNNVEAYFETTNTNGTASIFLNNDARPMWELAVSGNTSDSFIISNCTGAGGTTHYNALSITPAGAIGLGKKSAASVLDIAYADSSTGGIILTETTNSITTKIVNEGSSGSVGTTSSHKLGFRTAGVTRGVFDTNGRLGIGTDAPGALLDVRGSAVFNEDGDDVDFRIEGDTDANLFMVDASADKIGIGTATPSTLLNIVKDQNSDTTLLIENNTAGTGAYAGHRVESDAAGGGLKVFSSSFTTSNYNIADAVVLEAFTASSGGLQLATEGAHEIGIWTTSTRRATVTSGGCIGVGIQAPDGLLHVHAGTAGSVAAGSGACNLVVENNAAGGISILTPDANAGSLVFGSASDALGAEIKHTQSTTTMEVGTKESGGILKLNSADGTNAIYIDASQNVGIGTATPGVPLRVQGNACFTGTITAACVSGGGASLWSSGSNIVYVTGSCVGIGTNDPGTNNLLTAHIDQNAASTIKVLNETAGTAAASVFTANTNTSSGFLAAYSSSFTTANQKIADAVLLQADSTASAGLHLATATTAEIGFWTNNTRRMTITTGGCVGIGTATTSDEELKVQGDACVTGTMYAQTFSGGGVSDDVWTMAGQDAYYKELSAGDNVGIGTTTPAHTLHVGANAASAPALLVCDSGGSRIEVNSGAVKINNAYTMPAADGTAGQVICTDGSDTLTFGPGGYWTCVSGPELYYTGGNVGIGTDDPVVAFHVNNGASITNLPANTRAVFANTSDADAITRVGIYAGVASAFAVLDLGRNDADCRASITYDSSVDTLAFGTAGGAADVTINASGSVGIGTATPSHTLDVEGNIHASGNICATGDLTVAGDDITLGTNTDAYILVADGTNYNPVAMSGDVTISNTGAMTIAATSVENSMLAGSIANNKLSNSSVSYGGVSVSLGSSDATPAFCLNDAQTDEPTSDNDIAPKCYVDTQITAEAKGAICTTFYETSMPSPGNALQTQALSDPATASGNKLNDVQMWWRAQHGGNQNGMCDYVCNCAALFGCAQQVWTIPYRAWIACGGCCFLFCTPFQMPNNEGWCFCSGNSKVWYSVTYFA